MLIIIINHFKKSKLGSGFTQIVIFLNFFFYGIYGLIRESRIETADPNFFGKMSIQGVQPKLSAILNIKKKTFEIVSQGGKYILKPQNDFYPELPKNEALSMKLAEVFGIEVPIHGLIYSKDNSLTYFVKRFDRIKRKDKLAVEDFAQLTNNSRETKYNYSMEKLILVLDNCTFPVKEKIKLFRRCIFNYIIGNEDMHLKNFSLIRKNNLIELSPAYDLLSTTVAYQSIGKQINEIEEVALPLKGKKRNLSKKYG